MKNFNDILRDFVLSNEEMICVRGGTIDEDPVVKIVIPPVIL